MFKVKFRRILIDGSCSIWYELSYAGIARKFSIINEAILAVFETFYPNDDPREMLANFRTTTLADRRAGCPHDPSEEIYEPVGRPRSWQFSFVNTESPWKIGLNDD